MVEREKLKTRKLAKPFTVLNVDGTLNGKGWVTDYVDLKMETNRHQEQLQAVVTDIGNTDMFIGQDWLVKHNPEINWYTGEEVTFSRCPKECKVKHSNIRAMRKGQKEKYKPTIEEVEPKRKTTDTLKLPDYIKEYAHLFEKKNFDKLPIRREWDHEINLKEGAPSEIKAKVYPMTQEELVELDKFLQENLETEQITPSKSPFASPCFFINKKDGSK